jgi:CBS-domain-containing membrane protein
LVEAQIIESKKAYTELTIDNIKGLDPVIDDFERLRGNINSTEFLTTISRIYTYISEL